MVESIEQAFHMLETQTEGIPFEAIEYLRKQPQHKRIEERIVYALVHAYDNVWFNEAEGIWYHTPLWYAVVAEKHLSHALIEPVVSLFTQTDHDWEVLNDQGHVLVGLLSDRQCRMPVSEAATQRFSNVARNTSRL